MRELYTQRQVMLTEEQRSPVWAKTELNCRPIEERFTYGRALPNKQGFLDSINSGY